MIVGPPKDMSQAQQVIGSWIKKHTNQTINWLNASSLSLDTYRLDLSSQNLAAEFASAFPTIITTTNSTKPPSSTPTTAPIPSPPSTRKPPPSKNAWKTLSYSEQEEKLQPTMDTATTTTTEVSSSASHHTVHDQHDDLNILRVRLNDTDDQAFLQAAGQMIANISQHCLEAQVLARVLELEHQLQRLKTAGNDQQNMINKAILLNLVTTNNQINKEILTNDLGQRLNSKIRIRKTKNNTATRKGQ
jgi:hypothetical protein